MTKAYSIMQIVVDKLPSWVTRMIHVVSSDTSHDKYAVYVQGASRANK